MKSEEKLAIEDEMNLYIDAKTALSSIIRFDYPDLLNYQFIKKVKYESFCYLVDRYVAINELSRGQANIIKRKVKKFCNIKSKTDNLNMDSFFIKKRNEEVLKEVISHIVKENVEYRRKKNIINLNEFINKYDKKLLSEKFKINIEDRLYSEDECTSIIYSLTSYFSSKDMSEYEKIILNQPLPDGVTRRQYNKLIEKFYKIFEYYDIIL